VRETQTIPTVVTCTATDHSLPLRFFRRKANPKPMTVRQGKSGGRVFSICIIKLTLWVLK